MTGVFMDFLVKTRPYDLSSRWTAGKSFSGVFNVMFTLPSYVLLFLNGMDDALAVFK